MGVLPDEAKLKAVHNYPTPRDADATRRFVAFANFYRRFIKDFALVTKPLNGLTKKGVQFIWTNACENAFTKLKTLLTNPPILAYPDFTKQFIITVDASKIACGAVLSQMHNNIDRPISYTSKSFTRGESNKSTIEQELIAMHWAIKHYHPYIFGTQFLVRTP